MGHNNLTTIKQVEYNILKQIPRPTSHNMDSVALALEYPESTDYQTKTCSKCGKIKSINQFYKDPRHPDGLYSCCKICHKNVLNIIRSTPEGKAKVQAYNRSLEGKSAAKRYSQTPKGKSTLYQAGQAHVKRHPDRARCRWCLNKAIQRGTIIRPTECSRCGRNHLNIEAHHADYSKPFDVVWLCPDCHREVDVDTSLALVI